MYSREIESSVQMRLFSMSKRHFVVVFCLFAASIILSVCIGIAGPPIVMSYSINKTYDNNAAQISEILKSKPLTIFNQQLWLTANIKTTGNEALLGKLKFTVKIFGLKNGNNQKIGIFNDTKNKAKRSFKCNQQICEELLLAHINFITFKQYEFEVNFIEINKKNFKNIEYVFATFNQNFSQLEIWYRFTFLVLGFIATIIYNNSLRKFSVRDWSMEQKWIAVLLPALILYNNPLIPLKFVVNSAVTSVLDTIFQATFFCLLLLFWITVYHGMREIKRKFLTFHFPKILIVSLIWIMIIILPTYQAVVESTDPTFYYKLQSSFLAYKIILLVSIIIYILYTLFLIITACGELRTIPYFSVRIKFFTILMFIVLIFNIIIIYLKFGSGLFNDNFVFERASSRYSNSIEFCAQYGIINIYLFTMAYAYSPSKNAIHEANFQDDPNISMLNESDEDVLYGNIEETKLLARKNNK